MVKMVANPELFHLVNSSEHSRLHIRFPDEEENGFLAFGGPVGVCSSGTQRGRSSLLELSLWDRNMLGVTLLGKNNGKINTTHHFPNHKTLRFVC